MDKLLSAQRAETIRLVARVGAVYCSEGESQSRIFCYPFLSETIDELIDTNPKCRLFFKIDLQEYFVALICLSADKFCQPFSCGGNFYVDSGSWVTSSHRGINCKRPIPICRLFFKIDLLTDIVALCLTDFIDWRYIHSLVGIFDTACELLPPWTKELYLCTVAPLSSL